MDDPTAAQSPDTPTDPDTGGSEVIRTSPDASPLPTPGFSGLTAPAPVAAAPPESARALAFVAILVGGLLGGLVGFGIGDVLYPGTTWPAVGALAGALTGAVGLGVLANLTLRAMNEWKTATHPESQEHDASKRSPGSASGAP